MTLPCAAIAHMAFNVLYSVKDDLFVKPTLIERKAQLDFTEI